MGLIRDGINEVIATTHWNAAPMGIISREGTQRMVVFHGSHTAENIRRHGWVVANITFDPVVYVETAFGDIGRERFVPEKIGDLWVHRLAGAEAWAVFSSRVSRETEEALVVDLTPLYEQMLTCAVHPVNRGFSSIIEATVHAARYVAKKDPALMQLIEHHASIVRRCGGKPEMEALSLLQTYLPKGKGFS